jgi:hypothetical protein
MHSFYSQLIIHVGLPYPCHVSNGIVTGPLLLIKLDGAGQVCYELWNISDHYRSVIIDTDMPRL